MGIGSSRGKLDEAMIFSRALSQDEISTAMNDGIADLLPVSPVDKALTTTWGDIKMDESEKRIMTGSSTTKWAIW